MTRRLRCLASLVAVVLMAACDRAPGRRPVDAEVAAPDTMVDFRVLYGANCAGCHGPDGQGGAALALADPVYLAVAGDHEIRDAMANGVSGTAMPPFALRSGGVLTEQQIDAIVTGIRSGWGNPRLIPEPDLPPYAAAASGDAGRGREVFATYCARCHGAGGHGGSASSIVDEDYLALVSDQGLRTTVIAGRRELGAPDWRGNRPGMPMTLQDISDVVTWLSAQRRRVPGQPN